jgi:hypothetical protein
MHSLAIPVIVACLAASGVVQPADTRVCSHERRAQAVDRQLVLFAWRSRASGVDSAWSDGLVRVHGALPPGEAPAPEAGFHPPVNDCGSALVVRVAARGLIVSRAARTRAPPAA